MQPTKPELTSIRNTHICDFVEIPPHPGDHINVFHAEWDGVRELIPISLKELRPHMTSDGFISEKVLARIARNVQAREDITEAMKAIGLKVIDFDAMPIGWQDGLPGYGDFGMPWYSLEPRYVVCAETGRIGWQLNAREFKDMLCDVNRILQNDLTGYEKDVALINSAFEKWSSREISRRKAIDFDATGAKNKY
jgi:hypothetical protein